MNVDAIHRRGYAGALGQRRLDRLLQRGRQVTIDGRARREVLGIVADDTAEVRARGRQIGFGRQLLRAAGCELRFGLRNVGARDLAHIEAIARLFERLFQNPRIAALNLDDRRIAQIIHIDGRSLQQHRLFEHPEGLALTRHTRLGLADAVRRLLAVVKRLVHGQADAAGPQ